MIPATLHLRYARRPLREPTAWRIPGADPQQWLAEICSWNAPQHVLRLLPLPSSLHDRRPCAVLIVSNKGEPLSDPRSRCLPYAKIAGRLYVPIDATFDPQVEPAELAALLDERYQYVWHPSAGLIALEDGDVLRVADLLAAEPATSLNWDNAQPGVALSKQIVSLAPLVEPTIESIFQAGRDDIGDAAESLDELPPSPQEPQPGIANEAARQGKRALANFVNWAAGFAPAGNNERSWVARAQGWAQRQLADFQSGASAARNKAISRLLAMLESDPDRGLRFALPIGGDAHRGRAHGSDNLHQRNVDFSLARLGGGGPADYWDIQADYRQRLIATYRQLANRELRLGRYRRAAYIFAELLRDFDAAAGALVSGRHWREAAVLYRDRLQRPRDAASCLEKGGLWTEAIELYLQLDDCEKAGDLYRQIGQEDDAVSQYRAAIEKHRQAGDLIPAAKLLESKLQQPDEALEVLSSGWPRSSQAGALLREIMQLLSRLARHDAAQDWVTRVRSDQVPPASVLPVVNVITDTASVYPDRGVQRSAADTVRAIVAENLPLAVPNDARQLLTCIGRLAPQDRLLQRDCQRYLEKRPQPPVAVKPPPPTKDLQLLCTIVLPHNVAWKQVVACGRTIYAAGFRDNKLTLARCNWNGRVQGKIAEWKLDYNQTTNPVLLSAAPLSDSHLLAHVVFAPPLNPKPIAAPTDDAFPDHPTAGAVRGLSPTAVAASRTVYGLTWLVQMQTGGDTTLVCIGADGQVISTQALEWPSGDLFGTIPFPALHARGEDVFVGLATTLLIYNRSSNVEAIDLRRPIRALTGSSPNSLTRVAIAFDVGAAVFWHNSSQWHSEPLAADMAQPVLGFNRGGYAIAANREGFQVYETHGHKVRFRSELRTQLAEPLAVLSGPRNDEFGIACSDGTIRVYRNR